MDIETHLRKLQALEALLNRGMVEECKKKMKEQIADLQRTVAKAKPPGGPKKA